MACSGTSPEWSLNLNTWSLISHFSRIISPIFCWINVNFIEWIGGASCKRSYTWEKKMKNQDLFDSNEASVSFSGCSLVFTERVNKKSLLQRFNASCWFLTLYYYFQGVVFSLDWRTLICLIVFPFVATSCFR